MIIILIGGLVGFLIGGIVGGAPFGPIGSLFGSVLGTLGGLGVGALLALFVRPPRRSPSPPARDAGSEPQDGVPGKEASSKE